MFRSRSGRLPRVFHAAARLVFGDARLEKVLLLAQEDHLVEPREGISYFNIGGMFLMRLVAKRSLPGEERARVFRTALSLRTAATLSPALSSPRAARVASLIGRSED